jgi:hypothetical protein
MNKFYFNCTSYRNKSTHQTNNIKPKILTHFLTLIKQFLIMKKITLSLLIITSTFFWSCQKENQQIPETPDDLELIRQEVRDNLQESQKTAENGEISLQTRCNGRIVIVPANSHNALAHAIKEAGEDGIVYLKSGVHTETEGIIIKHNTTLSGQTGAVLKVNARLVVSADATSPFSVEPAIHVLDAEVDFFNLKILPIEKDGGVAILLENAHRSVINRSVFEGFQSAVLVEKSDKVSIVRNTIKSTGLWQIGAVAFAPSITVMNGKNAYVGYNEVSNSLFGIWACSLDGVCEKNYTYGNFIGIILCKVPTALQLPSGAVTGSINPATRWKTRNNKSTDNQFGYIVIDGANNNLIENNEAARNAAYDIELTTDTYRFGFLTPKSYNNTVNVGSFKNIRIKDCGENNQINGGIKVDTATDPCN